MSQKEPSEPDDHAGKKRNEEKGENGKNEALSLYKIEKLISKSQTYIGAIYLDSFKKLIVKAKTFSIIVYCDNHWFCIFSTPKTFEIFDPLGFLQKSKCINQIFMKFLKTQLGQKILYANPKIQSDKSFACGYFVSFFILNRESGLSFNEILAKFSKKYKSNERLVKLFLNNKLS